MTTRHVPVIHAIHLGYSDGRLHFGHSIIPTDTVVDVRKLLLHLEQVETVFDVITVVAEAARLPGEVFVVGRDHAAFAASGEGFILAKAATGNVAERAGFFAFVDTAEGFGVVFDDEQFVFFGERANFVHVADVAIKVHGHDRFGAFVDQFLGGFDTDAVVVQINVGKTRDGAGLDDGEATGDKSVARDDHFVAGSDAQGGERKVNGGRAGRQRHGVADAEVFGKGFLEALMKGVGVAVPGMGRGLGDVVDLLLGDRGS